VHRKIFAQWPDITGEQDIWSDIPQMNLGSIVRVAFGLPAASFNTLKAARALSEIRSGRNDDAIRSKLPTENAANGLDSARYRRFLVQ